MITTVLLDLDDTLLGTDTNTFVPQYVHEFAKLIVMRHPALQDGASSIGKALGAAVAATTANLDPTRTNLDVFTEALSVYSGLSIDALGAVFEELLDNAYMQLVSATRPIPLAPILLDHIVESGFKVAIATSPLFTLEAIRRRMAHAGIDETRVSLAFITNL